MKIVPVILASGFSRRYGSDKLMQKVLGKTVIRYVIDAVQKAGFPEIFVIVRKEQKDLISSITGDATYIENERAEEGQASSLRTAVSHLRSDADAILFLLGDQPLVRPETIVRLCKAHISGKNSISSCQIDGRLMPPVIFGSVHFDELMSLSGDTGAKPVLMKYQDRISRVEFSERYESEDVDTRDRIPEIERILMSI